jgi:hypothetical protein
MNKESMFEPMSEAELVTVRLGAAAIAGNVTQAAWYRGRSSVETVPARREDLNSASWRSWNAAGECLILGGVLLTYGAWRRIYEYAKSRGVHRKVSS